MLGADRGMTSQIEIPKAPGGASPPGGGARANGNGDAGAAAFLEGGSYDVLRKRLLEHAAELASKAEALNEKRKKVFGGSELALIANERVRTEHNCIARDMISVAGHLLFGFQVFLGLKTETQVEDVFAFYKFARNENGAAEEWDLGQLSFEGPGAFLAEEAFVKELRDTFKYSKAARLLRLMRTDTRLLAVVQTGATVKDTKVFRWSVDAAGRVTYMDARGDEDAARPRQHDFEWTQTGRADQVHGPHPHVNILDTVFVETVGGDLTIKVENNTKDGRGIYREPVDDPNQTLDDGDIAYAKVGQLILLRIKPFREEKYRYLVFDPRAQCVARIDAIGQACHELPEDHGIIFPGGYYLQSGEHKVFDGDCSNLAFERVIKSPNGEDVLYVYHADDAGEYLLLPYNLIRKEVTSAIRCHGYSLFADGTMAIFRAVAEPTRVHPVQIWQTPFSTVEHAAAKPRDGSYLSKVGNADLVRGISDMLSLRRLAMVERPTRATYEELIAAIRRATDAHYWLGHEEVGDLASTLAAMKKASALVLDEFDKVEAIERRAREALERARAEQKRLLVEVRPDDLHAVEDYLRALTTLRHQRGHLISLKDLRGMDVHEVAALEKELVERFDEVSKACVEYFLKDDAFRPLIERLDAAVEKIEATTKAADLTSFGEEIDVVHRGLELLAEVTSSLKIDDTTARTRILEGVSAAFSHQNRARAVWQAKKKELSGKEARAEFAVQFKLFSQAVTGAIALCDTPEKCDEQLSKLLLALEELEGKFGEIDELTEELAAKREEVNDAISAKRQQLLDERHRRAQNLMTAAERILSSVARRAATFKTPDELNAYFASDAMVLKLADVQAQLQALGDGVRADEVASRLKAARQDALRAMRDKAELFDGGEDVIKLGEHRFSVHTQPLELVLVPRDGVMMLHITSTDFFEPIHDPELDAAKDLWEQTLPNETPDVYRGEFLATSMLLDAEEGKGGLGIDALFEASRAGTLLEAVRTYAQDRLDEGYERGIHDTDAALILDKLLMLRASAGLLRFSADARALALLWLSNLPADERSVLSTRARSLGRLATRHASAQVDLAREIEPRIAEHARKLSFFGRGEAGASDDSSVASRIRGETASAARYLVLELASSSHLGDHRFVASAEADGLRRGLVTWLDEEGSRRAFEEELRALEGHLPERLGVALAYVEAFVAAKRAGDPGLRRFVREAAVMLVTEPSPGRGGIQRNPSAATLEATVEGLLGAHPRIQDRSLHLAIDEVLSRLVPFITESAPRFRAFRKLKVDIVERERKRLRMSELSPRALTSFVRNRLIDKVYLPLVGANLAKQIGAVGAKKRTDLMGMLLLVSPPGYGKTTLMEYVASKLGLVFMKVNGPAIGHDVTSLDPNEAKSSTARQEIEKINLAFEMGNNVMLYLDDIQHTSSELLQKFISLCDGQRRIEGVWNGRSKTYDLRGKKFCVVMAGNPYTESGARFQIPDMLANRADTYNLGDILGGQQELFASSYIENALTSNPTLAPLATRDPGDVQKLIRMAKGEDVPLTELSHGYSVAEVEEIVAVLRILLKIQKVLLDVNQEYIRSASQEDAYRTEPPFKLQGSYRNMNKLAEKVVAAMNDDEIEQLIDDHYASEAQTLTTGAQQNLLKLAEIRGRMTDEQRRRWKEIKDAYVRTMRGGKRGDDPVSRVTGALAGVDEQLQRIREAISHATIAAAAARSEPDDAAALAPILERLGQALRPLGKPPRVDLRIDDGSAAAAVAVVNVVREQTAAFQHVVASLTELAKRAVAPAPAGVTAPGAGTLPAPGAAPSPPPPSSVLDVRMEELVGAVKRLEQYISMLATSLPRFDVVLDASSKSTFWRSLDGDDVVRHGGVFVATYAKLPPLGAMLQLGLEFPGGIRFECQAQVSWVQEHLGDDAPAGFGAKLLNPTNDLCAVIAQFVRHREPLLRE
jgi:hypothetical protein